MVSRHFVYEIPTLVVAFVPLLSTGAGCISPKTLTTIPSPTILVLDATTLGADDYRVTGVDAGYFVSFVKTNRTYIL